MYEFSPQLNRGIGSRSEVRVDPAADTVAGFQCDGSQASVAEHVARSQTCGTGPDDNHVCSVGGKSMQALRNSEPRAAASGIAGSTASACDG
jgi:hypothetical protein